MFERAMLDRVNLTRISLAEGKHGLCDGVKFEFETNSEATLTEVNSTEIR